MCLCVCMSVSVCVCMSVSVCVSVSVFYGTVGRWKSHGFVS